MLVAIIAKNEKNSFALNYLYSARDRTNSG